MVSRLALSKRSEVIARSRSMDMGIKHNPLRTQILIPSQNSSMNTDLTKTKMIKINP